MANEEIVTTACNEGECHKCDGHDGVCECLCHMPPVVVSIKIDVAEHDAIVRALEEKISAWKEFADAITAFNRAMGTRFPVPNHIAGRYTDARKQLEKLGEAPP